MTFTKTTRFHLILLTLLVVALLLLLPFSYSDAAFDDVSLSSDAIISVGGYSLTVGPNSSIEQLTVNSDNFVVNLRSGSGFKVTSTDAITLSHNAEQSYVDSTVCATSESSVVFEVPAGGDANISITVTPSATACSSSTTGGTGSPGSSGGGGGGGGGSSYSAPVVTTPVTTTNTQTIPIETTTTALNKISTLNRTLRLGMSGNDVLTLQQFLNSDPDTRIASSGVGSPGNETDYFGSLTREAVKRFQAKYGVVSSGNEDSTGYGLVGPSTRAKLSELGGSGLTSTSSSSSLTGVVANFTKGLQMGMENSDVLALQQFLNSDPDTRIASLGVGSPGNETDYFGSLTELAVKKFQEKYGLAKAGDAGYGYVGPKTREKLNSLWVGSSNNLNSSEESQKEALQKQIEEALKLIEALQTQI